MATGEEVGRLEFGTKVLGAKVLFVLGHTSCGTVTAALKGESVPGQISSLFSHLHPAVKNANGDVDLATTQNVKNQMSLLFKSSPVIAELIKDGEPIIAGGIFDLLTGRVTPID